MFLAIHENTWWEYMAIHGNRYYYIAIEIQSDNM